MPPGKPDIEAVLRGIDDPEMPISIVDLGIVEQIECADGAAHVVVLPTFIGCPALDMIRESITEQVGALEGIDSVTVEFVHDPPWSPDRISDAGRERLREHGVTVQAAGNVEIRASAVPCPFCGARQTRLDSPFGPTRCRAIWYCDACRNAFEHVRS